MKRLLADEKTHDVTFTVKSQQFGAHVNVMGAASDAFHAMFYGEFERHKVIDIEDGTPQGFRVLLNYIYTDEATLTDDNVESVLNLSQKYLLWSLRDQAIAFIGKRINATNILHYLEIAKFFDGLEDKCLHAIDKHTEAILKSDDFLGFSDDLVSKILSRDTLAVGRGACKCDGAHTCDGLSGGLTELMIFERTAEWAATKIRSRNEVVTPAAIRETLGPMLYLIRFPAMDVIEFLTYPLKSGILDNDDKVALLEWFADQKEPKRFSIKKRSYTGHKKRFHTDHSESDESEVGHEPVVIRPTAAELEQKYMTIEYNCVEDQYKRNGENVVDGEGFLTFAHTAKNMYRKEEYDWEMVYVSREPGKERGEISWRIEIPPEYAGRVAGATIALGRLTTFKSGKILATVRYADTCARIPNDTGVFNIVGPLPSFPYVEVNVNFWGGERKKWDDVSWQHAQLFRTHMDQPQTNMSLRVNFV
ncbi:BTB/POZ domain-containing protein 6 [Aphelenchoides avenae]|nr:BTB/POZ domain-containing protein 6 [Aphelenchus avenae]